MADQSHLDILLQGVTAWNSWREQHPSIRPDLSEAAISQLIRINLAEGREPPETPYMPSLTGWASWW